MLKTLPALAVRSKEEEEDPASLQDQEEYFKDTSSQTLPSKVWRYYTVRDSELDFLDSSAIDSGCLRIWRNICDFGECYHL